MADQVTTKRSIIDPQVRANILGKIYAEILRWSHTDEKKEIPNDEGIYQDITSGSSNETLLDETEDGRFQSH